MSDELDRLHDELEQYGDRWRATVPPAQMPEGDLESPQRRRRRFLMPAAAAAAILVAVVGVVVGTSRPNEEQSPTDPKPTPTTTPPVAVGDAVPWEPLSPTGTRFRVRGIHGELKATNAPDPGQELHFVVTLTAREGDVSLAECPDYSITDQLSRDDSSGAEYALNCAAVPHRDSAGEPYLPDGVPVKFEMRGSGPGLDGGPELAIWKLDAPAGPFLLIPVAGSATGTEPPQPDETCPILVADVPDDLDQSRVHAAKDMGTPVSIGVIWSKERSDRVVNISSAPSDQAYGDGVDVEPTEREVQGTTASEIVVGDTHQITWRQPGATEPCSHWAVVVGGLSAKEVESVLESVREQP